MAKRSSNSNNNRITMSQLIYSVGQKNWPHRFFLSFISKKYSYYEVILPTRYKHDSPLLTIYGTYYNYDSIRVVGSSSS